MKKQIQKTIPIDDALAKIEPGMQIFISTGAAEPRTIVKRLMASEASNLQDLTLIQLVSLGDAINLQELRSTKYRLKTFFSGYAASDAIAAGQVDLIPSRYSRIACMLQSGQIPVDAAFVQISPPNEAGYCSFGIAMDVARIAMESASLRIGEINADIPFTHGDTIVHISEFDHLITSQDPPIYYDRWPVDEVFDRVAANVASVIEDGSCLGFTFGSLFEALSPHLSQKRDLGIHSPFVTDALMDLIESGAVTNRKKGIYQGKSVVTYAIGTPALMQWLDENPMVEFQSIDRVFNPPAIGRNPRFVAIYQARKVDLSGQTALPMGKGNVTSGPGHVVDFINGAELSPGGYTIFALPSRNRKGEPNIVSAFSNIPNVLSRLEIVNLVVTEYGIANLSGRTMRERAQALIEIAHPDDRAALIDQAKAMNILYPDQIFLPQSAGIYPAELSCKHTFKNNVNVRFRAIKPSDEDEMRRLFYRFSDESVYYRYFTRLKTMPHRQMQTYVNIDYRESLSIVGLTGPPNQGRIIAEARFVKHKDKPYVDAAFIVDEAYQGIGIATYLYRMLLRLAKERGSRGMTADVLASNKAMLKVFEKGEYPVQACLEQGIYGLTINFGRN